MYFLLNYQCVYLCFLFFFCCIYVLHCPYCDNQGTVEVDDKAAEDSISLFLFFSSFALSITHTHRHKDYTCGNAKAYSKLCIYFCITHITRRGKQSQSSLFIKSATLQIGIRMSVSDKPKGTRDHPSPHLDTCLGYCVKEEVHSSAILCFFNNSSKVVLYLLI